jgi:hypothetical protein
MEQEKTPDPATLKANLVGGIEDGKVVDLPWSDPNDILPLSIGIPAGEFMYLYELENANFEERVANYKYEGSQPYVKPDNFQNYKDFREGFKK